MINRKKALKIKTKHLAAEARIIRFEEQKSDPDTRCWLQQHRIKDLRPEARATNIAYAFALGRKLDQVEKYPKDIPTSVLARVTAMVKSYSGKSDEEFKNWLGSSMV